MRDSKRLSWLLRHGAREVGLPMDEAGWASIDDVLCVTDLDYETLLWVVEHNDKQRLQLSGDKIRAAQGHSFTGTSVTQEALESSWTRVCGRTEALWHGTRRAHVPSIRAEGIHPMDRTHVHLAGSRSDRVGKRHGVDVLLSVSPQCLEEHGIALFQSHNGVYLVRWVPPQCVGQRS